MLLDRLADSPEEKAEQEQVSKELERIPKHHSKLLQKLHGLSRAKTREEIEQLQKELKEGRKRGPVLDFVASSTTIPTGIGHNSSTDHNNSSKPKLRYMKSSAGPVLASGRALKRTQACTYMATSNG